MPRLRIFFSVSLAAALVAPVRAQESQDVRGRPRPVGAEMVAVLEGLRRVERKEFETDLRFVDDPWRLPPRGGEPFGVRVIVLSASDSGWSAVALSDAAPGTVCGIAEGLATAPIDPAAPAGTITCVGDSSVVPRPRPESAAGDRVYLLAELAAADRPRQLDCRSVRVPEASGRPERTLLEVVIGRDGLVQPAPVRILESRSLDVASDALWVLFHCRFTPGIHAGRPVRTAAAIPVQVGGDAQRSSPP